MANTDRPNGFKAVGTLAGSPWNARVRKYEAADRSSDTTNNHGDLYVGDPVKLSSGKVVVADSGDTILGAIVGIGNEDSVNDGVGPYNPSDLSVKHSPHTETSGVFVWVAPAENTIFEVQSDSDLDLSVGDSADINTAAATAHGSRTTGQSNAEITTDSNSDVKVVEIKPAVDNDSTLANARYWVQFATTAFAQ